MPKLKAKPEWLRANISMAPSDIRVDREAGVVRGFIVAEQGKFRSEGRGEFDAKAINEIDRLMRAESVGLKSRFGHPSGSGDAIGKHLGRVKNPRVDTVMRKADDGKLKSVLAVRADLHFDQSAYKTPSGDLATYIMDLASSDQSALGASLVLKVDETYRLGKDGLPLTDDQGNELPPIWFPRELHAADCVDEGDATRSFLSADQLDALPDALVRRGTQMLDEFFANQSREVVESRCSAWLARYLDGRYGEKPVRPRLAERKDRLEAMRRAIGGV